MATLFETTKIRNMTLANRSVRLATWEGLVMNWKRACALSCNRGILLLGEGQRCRIDFL